ncbi:hypothetical protein L1987_64269 [Smallanthus sonchifolius]|uniref:Uncharacterized protein n=1 Tax=Smallanthus sonchifolius TaxID=185202 RepID=A0ACB9CFW8_9ASTR|nr:hypothetical protein L1987_64269 [Smallanthus sonchifolius]
MRFMPLSPPVVEPVVIEQQNSAPMEPTSTGQNGMISDIAITVRPSVSLGSTLVPQALLKLKGQLNEVIKDQGGCSKVVEVVEDAEVASETDESSRFMKLS